MYMLASVSGVGVIRVTRTHQEAGTLSPPPVSPLQTQDSTCLWSRSVPALDPGHCPQVYDAVELNLAMCEYEYDDVADEYDDVELVQEYDGLEVGTMCQIGGHVCVV